MKSISILPVSVLVLAFTFLIACGDEAPSATTYNLNGAEYVTVSSGTLAHNGTSVSGTGSLVFVNPVAEQEKNFAYTFSIEDGGSVTLVTYSNNQLLQGAGVEITRSASGVTGKFTAPAGDVSISSKLNSIDATGDISLSVDVHNSEPHVLIYSGSETNFDSANALVNSEDGFDFPGKGTGLLWGFILNKATLKAATVGDAKLAGE